MLETCHPVAARVQDLAVLVDAERAAGRVGAIEGLEDTVGAERTDVAQADDLLGTGNVRRAEGGDESGGKECGAAAHGDGWDTRGR